MYTEEEKLDMFIEAVERLYPKAHVSKPMNSRHSDQKIMFDEAIRICEEEPVIPTIPTIVAETNKLDPGVSILKSRITQHFKTSGKLVAYKRNSKLVFRSRTQTNIDYDVYAKRVGTYDDAFTALLGLVKYL
jgi:hypothetical protein